MTSAGTLYPHMRDTIERVFSAPVFNRYGSREVGDIACECECHQCLHANPYSHHVEILRKDGSHCTPGEVGEVVVTLLTNYAMPIIRYRIGDMAAWAEHPCDCKRHWPSLQEVSGRLMDVFTRADGNPVMPQYFIHFFGVAKRSELDFIKKYQLIQEDIDNIYLDIIPTVDKAIAQRLILERQKIFEGIIKSAMGDTCKLSIRIVDDIPTTPSGKYQYIISKVNSHRPYKLLTSVYQPTYLKN